MERDHFILNAKSILLILFLVSSGCATTKNQPNDFNPEDPYEKSNRKVFEFNNRIDKLFLRPFTDFYDSATTEFAQTSITNFFSNLDDIGISFNNFVSPPRNQIIFSILSDECNTLTIFIESSIKILIFNVSTIVLLSAYSSTK